MAKKTKKNSTALAKRKSAKKNPAPRRARKNPAAWKFAVGIPVAAAAGYLLYKYVFMNEAQAAELIEGQAPAAQIPGPTETLPATGTAATGAEGAQPAAGPGGATSVPTAAPVLPTSGQACFAGKVGGMDIKIKMMFETNKINGIVYKNGKEASKISMTLRGALTSHVGDPAIGKLFQVRVPIALSDRGMAHNGWSLSKVNC